MLCVLFLQDKFIEYLLKGTQRLTPAFALANNETISHIINLSSAILLLSNNKCDLETNPNSKVSSKQQNDSKGLPAVLFLCGCDVVFLSLCCSLFLKTCSGSFERSHSCWVHKSQRRLFTNIQQAQSTRAGEYPTCCKSPKCLWLLSPSLRCINAAENRTTVFL